MSILDENLEVIFRSRRAANEWLDAPNSDFSGQTPRSLVERGQEGEVLRILKLRLGYIVNYD
jgi:hypothetical protein